MATAPCASPFWRFAVTGLDSAAITLLDKVARDKHVEPMLGAPNWLSFNCPSDDPLVNIPYPNSNSYPYVAEGVRHVYAFRQESFTPPYFTVRAAGTILQVQDSAQNDDAVTTVVAFDPWKLLYARDAQNLDGEVPSDITPLPAGYWDGSYPDGTMAGDVICDLLLNTIVNDGPVHLDAGAAFGGTGFWAGTIEPTLVLPTGWTVQQGKSVGEVWADLTSNADCDIVLTPIYDPVNRPGYTHELSIYALAGTVREDAALSWNLPPHSLNQIIRTQDGTQRANRFRYGAGPGGVDGRMDTALNDTISQARFGVYSAQQFFPGNPNLDSVEAWAALNLRLRANGKETLQLWPNPARMPCPFVEMQLGDFLPVYADGSGFRQDVNGFVRLYGFPIDIDDDGMETVAGMVLLPE